MFISDSRQSSITPTPSPSPPHQLHMVSDQLQVPPYPHTQSPNTANSTYTRSICMIIWSYDHTIIQIMSLQYCTSQAVPYHLQLYLALGVLPLCLVIVFVIRTCKAKPSTSTHIKCAVMRLHILYILIQYRYILYIHVYIISQILQYCRYLYNI